MYIFIYLYIDIRLWGVRDGQMGCNRVAGVGMMKGRGPTPQTQASPPHPRPPVPRAKPETGTRGGGARDTPATRFGIFSNFFAFLYLLYFLFLLFC